MTHDIETHKKVTRIGNSIEIVLGVVTGQKPKIKSNIGDVKIKFNERSVGTSNFACTGTGFLWKCPRFF